MVLQWYILEYSMILLADSKGPDQPAHVQADLGLRCPPSLSAYARYHIRVLYR